jgi:hypothetical protein
MAEADQVGVDTKTLGPLLIVPRGDEPSIYVKLVRIRTEQLRQPIICRLSHKSYLPESENTCCIQKC